MDNRLGQVSLTTHQLKTIELTSPLPYLLVETPEGFVVGNTFMNPVFGPMSGYRHLSRVDYQLKNHHDIALDIGILALESFHDRLFVLGINDKEEPQLGLYHSTTVVKEGGMSLGVSSQWGGYHYPAGVIPLESQP